MKYIHPSLWYMKLLSHMGTFGIKVHYATVYWRQRHDVIHFKKPRNLAEFLAGKVLDKDFNIMAAKFADKYAVRKYVESRGLKDHLLACYGVWNNPDNIEWDKLPDKFALKANNGCGGHVFCHEKTKLDINQVISQMKKAMSLDSPVFAFEPHYKLIPPKVYAEELMILPSQADIIDYKFMCTKGIINSILMVYDRTPDDHYKLELRDKDWKPMKGLVERYDKVPEIKKTTKFEKMKEIAQILSKDFDFVRVDLYEYNNNVYFGELTFTPQGGQMDYFTIDYLTQMYKHILAH